MNLYTKSAIKVPYVGLGTFPFQGKEMADVVEKALSAGYRMFDTSDDYRGEEGLGMVVDNLKNMNLRREDIFLQTKISDCNAHDDDPLIGLYFNPKQKFMGCYSVSDIIQDKIETSLRRMHTDYLDSVLIHYPFPEYYVEIWKVLIKLKDDGVVRYIGVSNFSEKHIRKIIDETGEVPSINECYISPIGSKPSLVEYCQMNNICMMSYSPLKDLVMGRIETYVLDGIARRYNKSVSQIVLRWNIQRGCMPLPKTRSYSRMCDNINIFDFSLTENEMSQIDSMNIDYQYLVESKICPGI